MLQSYIVTAEITERGELGQISGDGALNKFIPGDTGSRFIYVWCHGDAKSHINISETNAGRRVKDQRGREQQ